MEIGRSKLLSRTVAGMVAPGRVELPTFGLGNRCSIHLSYGARTNLPHYLMCNSRNKPQRVVKIKLVRVVMIVGH